MSTEPKAGAQIRGYRGEVNIGKPHWLPKPSAVNVQGLASLDPHVLKRKMGTLSSEHYRTVKEELRSLLGL